MNFSARARMVLAVLSFSTLLAAPAAAATRFKIAALPSDAASGYGYASNITNSGYILGNGVWTPNGKFALGGIEGGRLAFVNEMGEVAGATGGASWLWRFRGGTEPIVGGNGSLGFVNAINNHGVVVGRYQPGSVPYGGFHGFVWTPESGLIDVGKPGTAAELTSINDSGVAVGNGETGSYPYGPDDGPFLRLPDGATKPLATPEGVNAWAIKINARGDVLGGGSFPVPPGRPVFWSADGRFTDLGSFGGFWGEGHDLNDKGQVVGFSETADHQVRPFLWSEDTGMIDLGTLGGDFGVANAINSCGEVVGWSRLSTEMGAVRHAFYWSKETGMIDLGTLGRPGLNSEANDINDKGEIVGASDSADTPYPGWLDEAVKWKPIGKHGCGHP